MSWFDNLKQIFNTSIGAIINVDRSRTNIYINSNNTSNKFEFHREGDQVNVGINLKKLTPDEHKPIQQIIRSAVDKGGQLLLENEAEKIIEDFKEQDQDPDNQKILGYFKGKIPAADLVILRAALYLRNRFRAGDVSSISTLKAGIIEQYGIRGKKICNLCTAGYFENWIMPLYEELSNAPDFTPEEFISLYDTIIKESAFAVFVHAGMTPEETKNVILQKMDTNNKYGIKFLNIHGIGQSNVNKIKETIVEIESEKKLEKSIEERGRIIIARLRFFE